MMIFLKLSSVLAKVKIIIYIKLEYFKLFNHDMSINFIKIAKN